MKMEIQRGREGRWEKDEKKWKKEKKKGRDSSWLGIADLLLTTAGDNFVLPNKKFSYKNTDHILSLAS